MSNHSPGHNAAAMGDLDGLALTRNERVIVIALSYAWCTPLLYWCGERVFQHARAWTETADWWHLRART